MKRNTWIATILITALLLTAVGCTTNEKTPEAEIVLPPVRMSDHLAQSSWTEECSLGNLKSHHAQIACIRIGNWLGEGSMLSFYNVELTQRISGDLPESFILAQLGSSQASYGKPLFRYGDEHLVFVEKEDNWENWHEFYDMPFDHLSIFDIVTVSSGEKYAVDLCGMLSRTICLHVDNRAADEAFAEALREAMIDNDPLLGELGITVRYPINSTSLRIIWRKAFNKNPIITRIRQRGLRKPRCFVFDD